MVLLLVVGTVIPESVASGIRSVFRAATPGCILVLAILVAVLAAFRLVTQRRTTRAPTRPSSPLRSTRDALARHVNDVPWPLSVGLIAAIAAVGWYSLGRAQAIPRIFGDEMIYANLARALARGSSAFGQGYGIVTPAIDALAYVVTASDVGGYRLIQTINAVLMASAAFPAYLLARRALTHRTALMVGALTVIVPWMVYARFVTTEAAFFPAFLLFNLALVRALERPSLARQFVLVLALSLAFLTRAQAAALAGAVVSAVLLSGFSRSRVRVTIRAFAPTWILYAATAICAAALGFAGVVRPLGAYTVLLNYLWQPHNLLVWTAANVTALSLGLGVLVAIATPLGAAVLLARSSTPHEQALGATMVSSMIWLLLTVVVLSASPYGQGTPHERNLFYVTPLVFICAFAWAARGFPRPPVLTGATVAGAIGLAILFPGGVVSTYSIDALSFKLWATFPRGGLSVSALIVVAFVFGAALVLRLHTTWPLVVSVGLSAVGVAAASDYRSDQPRSLTPRYSWIDRTLPADRAAMLLWIGFDESRCPAGTPESMLDRVAVNTEYFNTRVGPVGHLLGDNAVRGLASESFAVRRDGVVTNQGKPLQPDYLIVDARVGIAGKRVARLRAVDVGLTDSRVDSALALWRAEKPLRLVGRGKALTADAACSPFPSK